MQAMRIVIGEGWIAPARRSAALKGPPEHASDKCGGVQRQPPVAVGVPLCPAISENFTEMEKYPTLW
ncbi:hypothetical protein [Paracoccus cavernae]|uniref:hypothetical protein n=1 Tax=Paracoccus cavernae TaxID=1571207 RepID=UPI003631C1CB